MESSSSSAPLKRARVPGSGNQVPSCLVDGCTADLTKCRDYHRRHKVCEVHSKTAKVTIKGLEQRFCQQCSRFHSLLEFDDGKRSCRKRLDGHNRRRRKPQPDSLSINSGRFLANHGGTTRYFPFSSPQIYSAPAITSSWMEAMKVETDINSELNFGRRNSWFTGSSSCHSYKGEKQLSFLQSTTSSSLLGVSICQPLLDSGPSSNNDGGGSSSRKMFLNEVNNHQAIDYSRSHSLLSSQLAAAAQESDLMSSMVQSSIPNLQYSGVVVEGDQMGSILATDGRSTDSNNFHGREMFRTGHPGSSASGTHQTLFFSWE